MRAAMIGTATRSILATLLLAATANAAPDPSRDLLLRASFVDRDRASALAHITEARDVAAAQIRGNPGDLGAAVVRATATGYRAKLTGSRSEAVDAKRQMEALVSRDPRNAEAQLALGGWHVGAVTRLGTLMARAALGAQRAVGYAALDRAVSLGGNRALFPGLAALLRLQADPGDQRGAALLLVATRADTPTAVDRTLQRAATLMLPLLRTGDRRAIRRGADRLLPFGQIPGES